MNEAEAILVAQSIGRSEAFQQIARASLQSKARVGLVVIGATVVGSIGGFAFGAYAAHKVQQDKARTDARIKAEVDEVVRRSQEEERAAALKVEDDEREAGRS